MKTKFESKLRQFGNNTGIEVLPEHVLVLGSGKKPAVRVIVNGYTFSSTVGVMGGKFLISFSKAHREASGIKGGDDISVTLELDTSSREVALPEDMNAALNSAGLLSTYSRLAPSHKKEYVRWVTEAKKPETRSSRIQKMIEKLQS